MKSSLGRWLLCPLFVFAAASCESTPLGGGPCSEGIDSDLDGINNDVECILGTNPEDGDSDKDGLSDGAEYNFPRICVADQLSAQRRDPVVSCKANTDCMTGEQCKGLDPTSADSDGDTVPDKNEDLNFDGTVNFTSGETDPRLYDTDGDGLGDARSGSSICRPDGLGQITRVPYGSTQLGHDPAFGTARPIMAPTMMRVGLAVDDAATGVAGLSIQSPPRGADLTADRAAIEGDVTAALVAAGFTVTSVAVGLAFTTHEQQPATNSLFRAVKAASSAGAARDLLIPRLSGGMPAMASTVGVDPANNYYVEVSVVRRPLSNDIIIAISPKSAYDNRATATAIRVTDLTNASGVAEIQKGLDYDCQGLKTTKPSYADIMWTVDISRSMDGNQVLMANTAKSFFSGMQAGGVDFRTGVFNAFSVKYKPTLAMTYNAVGTVGVTPYVNEGYPSGFQFLSGDDAMGPLKLCRYVTSREAGANGYCPDDSPLTNDKYAPFGFPDGGDDNEEPAAAAVMLEDMFTTNQQDMSVTNANWKWRTGTTKVMLMATDEPGTNDWDRYFKTENIPGTSTRWATMNGTTPVYDEAVISRIVNYYKTRNLLPFGLLAIYNQSGQPRACSLKNTQDLVRCSIEQAGGAFIDINTAQQADISTFIDRVVTTTIGASSVFKLNRTPITSTIKVTVRNELVPRSRVNGFDYNPTSRSIVFYGSQYRPQIGDVMYISYRFWVGSIG